MAGLGEAPSTSGASWAKNFSLIPPLGIGDPSSYVSTPSTGT